MNAINAIRTKIIQKKVSFSKCPTIRIKVENRHHRDRIKIHKTEEPACGEIARLSNTIVLCKHSID
jgi:hypothetical protein